MDKHYDQHPVYGNRPTTLAEREPDLPSGGHFELEMTAEELIAEHTGDVRWLSVPKNSWVERIEQAS